MSTKWTIASARREFSTLVRRAADAPQRIFRRDRLVAVLVDADTFEALSALRRRDEARTLGQAFAELREICAEEDYELVVPKRSDRANPFAETLGDAG